MSLSMKTKLLILVFQIIGIYSSNSKHVKERFMKHLEKRFDTKSNFTDEDHADIINRLDEMDKKFDTNLKKTEQIMSLVKNIDEKTKAELQTSINNLSLIQRNDCKALTEQIERNIIQTFQDLFATEQDRISVIEKEVKETRTIVENNNRKLYSITRKSCYELFLAGLFKSGVNTLENGLDVFCDQTTDGGGWTVFQRRLNGKVDFYRKWTEYKDGFGDLNGEFWLGNKYLSDLTASGDSELRIDMADFEGNRVFAKYSKFKVLPEEDDYKLEVSGYSGNAGNSFDYHNGMPFTTFDNDNDESERKCAIEYRGAWWYKSCYISNLNGKYFNEINKNDNQGINWNKWKSTYSLKFVEMKFRSKS